MARNPSFRPKVTFDPPLKDPFPWSYYISMVTLIIGLLWLVFSVIN